MPETNSTTPVGAYYLPRGGQAYASTRHAQGAWNPHEQHMAPVVGLMVRALEAFAPRPELRLARLSFDILGLIPAGEFTLVTTLLRPGRTIELLQTELVADGRVAVRATAWRLATSDTRAVAACEDAPLGQPEDATAWDGLTGWPGGFIASLTARTVPGHRPGRGRAWLHTAHPLVAGEDSSTLARLLGLADSANGVSARMAPAPGGYTFANVDLSLHLYRDPVGEWLGLDSTVTFGSDGIGLTSSVLHDTRGPFGRAEQILTLRPVPVSQ